MGAPRMPLGIRFRIGFFGSVAQLVRATDSYPVGREFESPRCYFNYRGLSVTSPRRSARSGGAFYFYGRDADNNPMSVDFVTFLAEHRRRVEPLEVEMGDAWWAANIASNADNEARAAAAQKAIAKLYADQDAFAYLQGLDAKSLAADDRRQHQLLLNAFAGNQMDDAVIEELVDLERLVESAYNSFRPNLRGEPAADNRLKDILRTSDDAALRREAWEASKEIGGHVERDVLKMVALRNREARRLGYPDYYTMALELQELEVSALFRLLDEVEKQTDPLWKAWKGRHDAELASRFGVGTTDLRPWHYGDPFFQESPPGEVDLDRFYRGRNLEELARRFYGAIGLEIGEILTRSDLYEKDGKSQHAFCLHVGRFHDVRVLCNVTTSERWMGTLLHEFGHAVYDQYLGSDLPFFLRDTAHTLTTEAIAMLMGRLSRSAPFLSRYAGVPADEAAIVARSADAEQAAGLLIMARWCLVMTHFERGLYADPGQDLNRLWWRLVERFQGVTPPEGRDAPDWAAKLHLALAPVYYQNYLLGEMFASQLLEFLRRNVLGSAGDDALVSSGEVGAYLKKAIFEPGARYRWDDLIVRATGEPLNPAYFVRHLAP